ncbi:NAD-dependent epimerase/dehydratase family protein [Enterococcus sp. N342-3-1-2]
MTRRPYSENDRSVTEESRINFTYDGGQWDYRIGSTFLCRSRFAKDAEWHETMADCTYVFSVASPVFFGKVTDEAAVIRPATEGIIRILQAAKNSPVKRVVMTSNFGAVGFSNLDKHSTTTEADWTDPEQPGLSIYEKSKLLDEQAAWAFVATEKPAYTFATVNSVAIFGPSLDQHVSGSFTLIDTLLAGANKRYPNIPLNIVDVRDVAKIHLLAMFTPEAAGQRFIASCDGQITMKEMATIIQQQRPQLVSRVTTKEIPQWIIKFGALFNHQAKEGALFLSMNRQVSNQKAKAVLGWHPLADNQTALLAAVDSLITAEDKK